jgi:hypothetical protein
MSSNEDGSLDTDAQAILRAKLLREISDVELNYDSAVKLMGAELELAYAQIRALQLRIQDLEDEKATRHLTGEYHSALFTTSYSCQRKGGSGSTTLSDPLAQTSTMHMAGNDMTVSNNLSHD